MDEITRAQYFLNEIPERLDKWRRIIEDDIINTSNANINSYFIVKGEWEMLEFMFENDIIDDVCNAFESEPFKNLSVHFDLCNPDGIFYNSLITYNNQIVSSTILDELAKELFESDSDFEMYSITQMYIGKVEPMIDSEFYYYYLPIVDITVVIEKDEE